MLASELHDKRAETTVHDVVQVIARIFRDEPDKHAAHRRARPVLEQAAREPAFITGALQRHIVGKGGLDARHYPVVSLLPATAPEFSLAVNCWIPLPNRATNLTTKAIHHHGSLLLSTANVFGPGYEHLLFSKPVVVDEARDIVRMDLTSASPHRLHEVAFVDAWIPHVPLYPAELTITAALWSDSRRTDWRDRIKQLPLLQENKKRITGALHKLGLARRMSVNVIEYFDYHPAPSGDFYRMRERQEFERGPNEDYLFSLCHTLQGTGNDALACLMRDRLRDQPLETQRVLERLLPDLERGRPIAGRFSEHHYDVPFANFTKLDIERAIHGKAA